ncbi:MAG TPA: class I SAM-dependent methyltransferase [Thermoplasmata archaeon]|nr:class I SAM-dependent methyltransferase [Thermoplasmata archaeon]
MARFGASGSGRLSYREGAPEAAPPSVPALLRNRGPPVLLRPAARKEMLRRMQQLHRHALDQVAALTGASTEALHRFRRELEASGLAESLVERGAGPAFADEFPQGALLYLLVRALGPNRVVETGVHPGYTSSWILSALDANGSGSLTSLGPGSVRGRAAGIRETTVGQLIAPRLRSRWTLVLGNSEENLRAILADGGAVDLFLYDNGPDADRARFELRTAWGSLSSHGILLAHHSDATPVWAEMCSRQGLPPQLLDSGPPPLGALSMTHPETVPS